MHPLEKYEFEGVISCYFHVALKKLLLMCNSIEFIFCQFFNHVLSLFKKIPQGLKHLLG